MANKKVLDHFLPSQSFLFSDVFSSDHSEAVDQTEFHIVLTPITTH